MSAPRSALLVLVASLSACSGRSAPPPQGPPGYSGSPTPYVPSRPVDTGAVQALIGRVPCAPKEVAPGTWARFDCRPFRDLARAVRLSVPRRMGVVSGALPAAVDHRASGTEGPVKAQGAVGACTAFSLSTAMDNAVRRMGRQEVVSPLHVWSKYAVPEMGTAGDETVNEALTMESVWPYDPAKACRLLREPFDSCGAAYKVQSGSGAHDPTLKAEKAIADGKGRFRLRAVEQLSRPVDLDELSAVLAGGDDVWASFSVDEEAWSHRSLRGDGVIPDYSTRGDEGHAVVLAGYRSVNGARQFLVHNSWGTRWGVSGYGWISDAMVQKYLRGAYKVRVEDVSAPSTPTPPPPGASACPAGQVPDAVLGTCATLCASGSPPAAGVCLPTVPGLPALPWQQPPAPGPAPQSACPAGQAPDMMTGQCMGLCPGGRPAIGAMCLPGM